MTIQKWQVQAIIGVAVLVFAIGIISTGGAPNPDWLRFYSFAVTAAVVLVGAWERWIWRWKIVQRLKFVPRNLNGTWKGTLASQWIDPETGKAPPSKPAYLVIRQTASTVSATMFTDEMRSRSSLGLVSGTDGAASLDYMYLSRPDSSVEHRSRMHHGSTSLDVIGDPVTRLRGRYWTTRDSKGELDFKKHVQRHVDDYDSASDLFR